MLNFAKLCKQKKTFRRLTGVTLDVFNKIVNDVRQDWEKLQKQKKVSGRPSRLATLEDEILLAVIYYRFYVTHMFLGYLFNLHETNVCRHLKRIEPLLAKNLAIKKDRTLSADDLENIIVDATEIRTQRPERKQYYSGKKKCHTQKVEMQVRG